jgi:outer membrane protein assembly factor BamB
MDGKLHAVDFETGKPIWQFATKGEKAYDDWDAFLSSPVIDDNVIYFGSSDKNMYAVDVATGLLKWQYTTGEMIHSSPALDETTIYFGNCEGKVYALDRNTGTLKWSYKTKGYSDMPKGEIIA